MDWHIVNRPEWFDENGKRLKDPSGQNYGWTGFTWNKSLFPDPQGFLKWTNENHIETCMNLHPASGIQPHEEQYEAFAKSMGIDPSTKNMYLLTLQTRLLPRTIWTFYYIRWKKMA